MNKLGFNSRRFKYGSMATIITAGFVVLVILINLIAGLILARFPAKVDLTEDNIYQITEDSIEYVEKIDREVNMYICTTEDTLESNQYYKQAKEVIEKYAQYNNKIKISYVDLMEDASFARDYAEYGVKEGTIIVDSGLRVRAVPISTLFATMENSQTGEQKIVSQTEKTMTSALSYVCDEKVMKATVIKGTSDIGCAGLTAMLTNDNYEMSTTSIATDEISSEMDLAVIYAPTIDYTTEQISKLDTFLDNNGKYGKNVLYVASHNQPELPNIETFLSEWGIEIGNEILVETDSSNVYSTGQNYIMGLEFPKTNEEDDFVFDFAKDLRNASLPYIGFSVRPVNALFEATGNRGTSSLLLTSDSVVSVPFNAGSDFNIDAQTPQQYNAGLVGMKSKQLDGDNFLTKSSVMVFGGIDMFNEQITSSASYNNNEYTMNVINQVVEKSSDTITIPDVSFDTTALKQVTSLQYNVLSITFTIGLPIALVLCSLVIWIRRRNK